MTFSAESSRRLPAYWPSVGSLQGHVQDEHPFIAFLDRFVAWVKTQPVEPDQLVKATQELMEHGFIPESAPHVGRGMASD